MKKSAFIMLFLALGFAVVAKTHNTPKPAAPKQAAAKQQAQQQQQPRNCVKQPEIIKKTAPAPKPVERKPNVIAKGQVQTNTVPHYSIFNFFNSFYTKDTLDRLQVM